MNPKFRFARRDFTASGDVKVSISFVEGTQPLLLLLPALLAPTLELLFGDRQAIDGVPAHVEMDFPRKVAAENVFLRLRNVARVGHGDVMDGVKVVAWKREGKKRNEELMIGVTGVMYKTAFHNDPHIQRYGQLCRPIR